MSDKAEPKPDLLLYQYSNGVLVIKHADILYAAECQISYKLLKEIAKKNEKRTIAFLQIIAKTQEVEPLTTEFIGIVLWTYARPTLEKQWTFSQILAVIAIETIAAWEARTCDDCIYLESEVYMLRRRLFDIRDMAEKNKEIPKQIPLGESTLTKLVIIFFEINWKKVVADRKGG